MMLTIAAVVAQVAIAAAPPMHPASSADAVVALFSTQRVERVELAPRDAFAWTARCATCTHTPLHAPLVFAGGPDIFAGGMLRARDLATGGQRTAAGLWHLHRAPDSSVDVVLTLPVERYVQAVLNAEAAPDEPAASLEALAVVACTYAHGSHVPLRPGHLPAMLCDSTACQAMRLEPVSAAVAQAVFATAGETLWFRAQPAQVFFSQHCGGRTAAGAELSGGAAVPYLPAQPDPFCLRRGPAAWHAELTQAELTQVGASLGLALPAPVASVRVAERTASGRAAVLELAGAGGVRRVPAQAFRLAVGRTLGWNRLRSDAYDMALRGGRVLFDGHGHGHGVGLCQAGAAEMAAEGRDAHAILRFYFPGTTAGITAHDDGWHAGHAGPVTVRAVAGPTAEQRARVAAAWSAARERFPGPEVAAPVVAIAPSVELFRQMTGAPGTVLAVTRGSRIVLEPWPVLAAHGTTPHGPDRTLLHEMLHVRVEAEATARAPLWLREGMVEVLAEDAAAAPDRLAARPEAVDAMLAHPASAEEFRQAHRAAEALVRASIARFGLPTVRGWLSSGVPAR